LLASGINRINRVLTLAAAKIFFCRWWRFEIHQGAALRADIFKHVYLSPLNNLTLLISTKQGMTEILRVNYHHFSTTASPLNFEIVETRF
jgi:hypothetical protein